MPMHCIYNQRSNDVRVGPGQPPEDSGAQDKARGGRAVSQDVESEPRFVYYGESDSGRLLAIVITERGDNIRVVTAYDPDAGQRRDYLKRRAQGE